MNCHAITFKLLFSYYGSNYLIVIVNYYQIIITIKYSNTYNVCYQSHYILTQLDIENLLNMSMETSKARPEMTPMKTPDITANMRPGKCETSGQVQWSKVELMIQKWSTNWCTYKI